MRERYLNAAHAMQSGVAVKMGLDPKETSPKHLRVGVNSAMVEHAALAQLLIKKGVITEEEYAEAVTLGMEAEAQRYVTDLEERLGSKVTLG